MALASYLLLPVRLAVAATQTTLALGTLASPDGPIRRPGGYADLLLRVIGEDGHADTLVELLTSDEGPMRLAATINDLTAPDRPLGRMLAREGVLDRMLQEDGPLARLLETDGPLERLIAAGGPLEQLTAAGGPLDRLLATDGALDRVTAPGGVLDRLLAPGGLLNRVLTEDGFVEKLIADGGTLDQLVALGDTLEAIRPRLAQLADVVPALSASASDLGRAVGPLGDLAGRLPLSRRRSVPDAQ